MLEIPINSKYCGIYENDNDIFRLSVVIKLWPISRKPVSDTDRFARERVNNPVIFVLSSGLENYQISPQFHQEVSPINLVFHIVLPKAPYLLRY